MEGEDFASYMQVLSLAESFSTPFVIKAAIKLGIPDILAKSDQPVHYTAITAAGHTAYNSDVVRRLLQGLCRKGIFKESPSGYFAHNKLSKWLVTEERRTLAPLFVLTTAEPLQAAWQHLHEIAADPCPSSAFARAHGKGIFEYASSDPVFAKMWFSFLSSFSSAIILAVLQNYMGFKDVQVLVDVGGGTGFCLSKILEAYPHIQGINLDLPYAVADAPAYKGVTHVAGDMFDNVPKGDAIYLQEVLHNWSDAMCKKLLKNCYSALMDNGKLIIVDMIVDPQDKNTGGFDLDLMMMVVTGGRERNKDEWDELLQSTGFKIDGITRLSGAKKSVCVIEACKKY